MAQSSSLLLSSSTFSSSSSFFLSLVQKCQVDRFFCFNRNPNKISRVHPKRNCYDIVRVSRIVVGIVSWILCSCYSLTSTHAWIVPAPTTISSSRINVFDRNGVFRVENCRSFHKTFPSCSFIRQLEHEKLQLQTRQLLPDRLSVAEPSFLSTRSTPQNVQHGLLFQHVSIGSNQRFNVQQQTQGLRRRLQQRQQITSLSASVAGNKAESAAISPSPSSSTPALQYDASKIRNFSIIAHIDHGKSTLADRLLETTKTVAERDMAEQLLDNMDLERERGITIKLQAARVLYKSTVDNEIYFLNLIDTPGHVDFSYEVSRSLAACEGALLVVDASQGIEAQTLANVYLALDNNLEIIPVLNKIDLPAAEPDRVASEIEETIGLDCTDIVHASAKAGIGIVDILERIVRNIPPPQGLTGGPFRALIFDSYYDSYKGVVVFFRVVDGGIQKGDKIRFLASEAEHEVAEVGIMQPNQTPVSILQAGEVGYFWGNIKDVMDARVGDTIVLAKQYRELKAAGSNPPIQPLPGYAPSVPMVYCGLFPVDADQYEGLRDALGKLRLNDAALSYEPENSGAMGFGFRCGFLGLLHMEIIQERLQREYDIDLVVTAPTVVYKVLLKGKEELIVDAPSKMPDLGRDDVALEPYVRMDILTPSEYNGAIIELGQERRGELIDIKYLTPTRSTITYELPLAEVITDFFNQLKSATKGYASMEYEVIDYRPSDLVRMDIKINYEDAPPLACIVHRDKAQTLGRRLCASLKEYIPRQMFKIPIQACLGVKIIASESINPMRKDVLAKCYGGDITRKKKLLQKQAKGKKRMKAIGRVNVPQEAFTAVLRLNDPS